MKSSEIRERFLNFFASKQHKIVPSAPLVNKDDPTLMFVNAGMNPFKDYFLGNKAATDVRVVDTQKCLRVSGKHNDLEEVGVDGYHHTLFEMLGNWSFGDYFKEEAIEWAWELLTKEFKIDPDRIYVSYFGGDAEDNLAADEEAKEIWANILSNERILPFSKKDNFWEMGDTGPCGPCSEIHVDLRSDEERAKGNGASLVNMDHPEVIEIWNLVFIQFERKADRSLVDLPAKHIDTGMGFERVTMALQGKTSSYNTDLFEPTISFVEKETGLKYEGEYDRNSSTFKKDMAFRVLVDHIRAVSFAIADGQLPSNTGAGYVIRRILRRAVRYYYSFLNVKQPLLYRLMEVLAEQFKNVFPELDAQRELVGKIIKSEEESFLKTLGSGIERLELLMEKASKTKSISGRDAFELFDTFGFPFDLTMLIASENGYEVDEAGFDLALKEQKLRSKTDAVKQVGDWMVLSDETDNEFVGYDTLTVEDAQVIKYRTVNVKKKDQYQMVLNRTPFYAESGGQHGDSGWLWLDGEKIEVLDTQKENDLIIHVVNKLPKNVGASVKAEVNRTKREATSKNHTAVHLMHAALHEVLGNHAVQKGQDLNDKKLRFDFSHFSKVTDEELSKIEWMVNEKIRANIALEENRNMPLEEARASGAMMLFGEKYGEFVRMITYDKNFSRELCGGTHVSSTGEIGLFKIITETSVAAGVRRIEALTAAEAEAYVNSELEELNRVRGMFKNPKNVAQAVEKLQEENKSLKKQLEKLDVLQAKIAKAELDAKVEIINGVKFVSGRVEVDNAEAVKTIAHQYRQTGETFFLVVGTESEGKANLTVALSEDLVKKGMDASKIIRNLAKHIRGGGGGQSFIATAGGKDISGLPNAIAAAKTML
jgi:alanyl-tRNA synthetase